MKTESRIRPTEKYQFNEGGDRNFVVFNDLNSIEETIREENYVQERVNAQMDAMYSSIMTPPVDLTLYTVGV